MKKKRGKKAWAVNANELYKDHIKEHLKIYNVTGPAMPEIPLIPKIADKVNHPSHYNQGRIEVIDAIEDWRLGYHLGNVVKYVARSAYKGHELEDLEKAAWYLARKIKLLKATARA